MCDKYQKRDWEGAKKNSRIIGGGIGGESTEGEWQKRRTVRVSVSFIYDTKLASTVTPRAGRSKRKQRAPMKTDLT